MSEKINFRIAKNDDAEEIYDIMKYVYDNLENKSFFVCDDLEFVKRHINNDGFIVAACNEEGKIIASLIARFPYDDEDNLGRDVGLSSEELKRAAHLESMVVLPGYRGNNLQYSMIQFAESKIDKSIYKYLFATAAPDNIASCRNIEKSGYRAVATKEKYGGLLRRIYMKKLYP